MLIHNEMLPSAKEDDETAVYAKLPGIRTTTLEPVGRWFEAYCSRRRHKQTLSHASLASSSSDEDNGDLSDEEEEDEELLRSLDPTDWKNQDHYVVLGLSKLRYLASEEKIKSAYKKKVLRHHPDKRRARGLPVKDGDDDYFTCITRAYEVLGVKSKRQSYDSVDHTFDDTIPSAIEPNKTFYDTFGPVFKRNARWSNKKHVPELGDENATYDQVNHFYSFWYDFDSWREYSYLDEEEKEKGENRDERRWIEKQNKAARQKRKKEEIARVRQLVDNAYSCDPRIHKFKEEEKAKKLAAKQAKKDAARQKAEEEERIRREAEEAERKQREAEEEEERQKAAILKKEKEAQKKALKKERKTLRTKLKESDYFASDEAERVTNMTEVDKLAELLSLTSLQSLNEELTSGDDERAKTAFLAKVKEVAAEQEEEKRRLLEAASKSSSSGESSSKYKTPWTEEEQQLLVKAVKTFPAGTVQRWETIANFITMHLPSSNRTAKEVLHRTKEQQKLDPKQKEEADRKAYEHFLREQKSAASVDKVVASERFDTIADQQIGETGSNPAPWTAEEQKILEQALRTYPASVPERWEKISEQLPQRSKKDCMKRYKELVELVRAKKAAAAAAAKKK